MTSTEFSVGINGTRVSSKVLRPPGGGSSDIFGLGSTIRSNEAAGKPTAGKEESTNTQNRLFGIENNSYNTPTKSQVRNNVFESQTPMILKSAKKPFVRRNPITGEEIVYPCNNEMEDDDKQNSNDKIEENHVPKSIDPEENNSNTPTKPIQTSIRVKNPPGGKSSGIF